MSSVGGAPLALVVLSVSVDDVEMNAVSNVEKGNDNVLDA